MSQLSNPSKQFASNFKVSNLITKAKRDLILSILRSTTTKREAKSFLEKYQNQFDFKNVSFHQTNIIGPLTSNADGRQNVIENLMEGNSPQLSAISGSRRAPLRIALFTISISNVTSEYYSGIAETLNRLVQLGVSPIIIWGEDELFQKDYKSLSSNLTKQAEEMVQHLSNKNKIGIAPVQTTLARSLFVQRGKEVSIDQLNQLLIPLHQGIIPIILPTAFAIEDGSQKFLKPKDALFHICSRLSSIPDILSIEKVVFIDSLGGIPSIERNQTSHVFINLSQEYSDILSELYIGHLDPRTREVHLSNLESMNKILRVISEKTNSNTTTGIITTPAVMSVNDDQLNPVVYNVLTDRPIISSSLPSTFRNTPQISTSIIKKGFEVTVIDEDTFNGKFSFRELVKRNLVEEDRLISLINDSFGKSLKVDEYLRRIDDSLATLIIVGDYEGAAIVTWEHLSNGEKIPYLDKFAIARKNQGIPGLADVIFKVITQSHQSELLWRSRADNPVNKWYFERCKGSVKIPHSPWKFFYSGDKFHHRMGTRIDGSEQQGLNITERLALYSKLVENLRPSF